MTVHAGTAQGGGPEQNLAPPPPPLFWLIRSLLFFFYFSKPGLSFTKKYITLFYVKYADLLENAALFWFVHFDPISFFEGFLVQTRPDEAVCR